MKVKKFDPPLDIMEKKLDEKKVSVRCPDCPWKAGMKDETTTCSLCAGTGQILADPLE